MTRNNTDAVILLAFKEFLKSQVNLCPELTNEGRVENNVNLTGIFTRDATMRKSTATVSLRLVASLDVQTRLDHASRSV